MAAVVDLTSDGESPSGIRVAQPKSGSHCINLLSSDEEPSHKKQKLGDPHQPLHSTSPDTQAVTFSKRVEEAASQANPTIRPSAAVNVSRQGRQRRPLKKAYGDDFDYDLDFSQSQGGPASQTQDDDLPYPTQQSLDGADPEDQGGSGASRPRQKRGRLTEEEKAAREEEKERKKQERMAAREDKKRQKEAEKSRVQAQRAQQRLDRQRETGKTALRDLVVHLDPDLAKHRAGREFLQKLEDTYKEPGVHGPQVDVSQRLPMWPLRSATWSRLVYKTEEDIQAASQSTPQQQSINYILVYFTAEEFVARLSEDRLRSLVQQAANNCPQCTLCLMIDGLEHYLTLRQRREFQANGPGGGGFNRAFVDDFLGSMAVRWPGVRHVVVHDTAQAAEHFAGVTRALAEQPYRAETAYTMSFGSGKPDTNTMQELLKKAPLPHKDREIWFKALSCIPKLGPQGAHAVSTNHQSLGALIARYQNHAGSLAEKEGMLQNLSRFGGSRVGPVASRSVFQILTSEDPNLCL